MPFLPIWEHRTLIVDMDVALTARLAAEGEVALVTAEGRVRV